MKTKVSFLNSDPVRKDSREMGLPGRQKRPRIRVTKVASCSGMKLSRYSVGESRFSRCEKLAKILEVSRQVQHAVARVCGQWKEVPLSEVEMLERLGFEVQKWTETVVERPRNPYSREGGRS